MSMRFLAAVLLAALAPSSALAAAPPNDTRSGAISLDPLPTTVRGTTAEATFDQGVPYSGACGFPQESVWYSATAAASGRIALRAVADGDLDLIVDVFKRRRSQLEAMECDPSDGRGIAELNFIAEAGDRFLIRISHAGDSEPGTFSLRLSAPFLPASPPGRLLPARGATGVLNRAENSDAAHSAILRTGTTYRLRLSGRLDSCRPTAEVYAPGTTSFDDQSPVRTVGCGQSWTFTPRPGEGGRYPIRVVASRRARLDQGYHLQVARAGADDTAPGLPIFNHRSRRGGLHGDGVDALDLYRFTVTSTSQTVVRLSGGQDFTVTVIAESGKRMARGDAYLTRILRPGAYFIAVRARGSETGRYRLRRDSRVITHTRLRAAAGAGRATLTTRTSPAAAGPVQIVVERHDPIAGWLFADQFDLRASGSGSASAVFTGRQGRYRAQARFAGTRDAADSRSRVVRFRLRAG